jgi:hypothetical protein
MPALLTQRYLNVAQLRALLLGMERDLGLGDLSQNEKDVFYAVQSVIAGSDGVARSDDIKGHSLVFEMTQPTFHRSLKNLLDRGLLAHAPSTKAGSYVATEPENRQLEAVASI